MSDVFVIVWHFIRTRWFLWFPSREMLLEWQEKQLNRFLDEAADHSGWIRERRADGEFPIIAKKEYRERFSSMNAFGISIDDAEQVALKAERERDFKPTIGDGVSVGLSSGTSGKRSVFLVTKQDRRRWAGIILARALSSQSLRQVVSPWKPPLKIAFFLRADSNLYQTIASKRIDFRYFDLLDPFDDLIGCLQEFQPDVLIAPATVLAEIAGVAKGLRPSQVISVAEVLDDRDERMITERLGIRPAQIYQATEGFLGSTCRLGNIHLNEEHLRIEQEWIDEKRFHPLITDFSRKGQYFVRFRLDDILVADERICGCGRVSRVIERIEGRADEVLRFGVAIFPDAVRQSIYAMDRVPENYRIEQHGGTLHLFLKTELPEVPAKVIDALSALFERVGVPRPDFVLMPWSDQPAGEKQRRIRCVTPLES